MYSSLDFAMKAQTLLAPVASAEKCWFHFDASNAAASNSSKVAEIHIMEEIGGWGVSARQLCSQIRSLPKDTLIKLHIFSGGGSVLDGNEIFNTLDKHEGVIEVEIGALCASIATVIACAGDKIVMAKNGLYMIHNPWTYTGGESKDLRRMADVMDKMKANLVAAYLARGTARGLSLQEDAVSKLMDEETWMTAEEAVEAGFIDEVLDKEDPEVENLRNRVDINQIKNRTAFLSRLPKTQPKTGELPRDEQFPTPNVPENQTNQLIEDYRNGNMKIFNSIAILSGTILPACAVEEKVKEEAHKLYAAEVNGRIYNNTPPPAQVDPAEFKRQVTDAAKTLLKEKQKRDKDIDDMVVAIRDRDKKDFSALATEMKDRDATPAEFAQAMITSDKFKVHNVTGSGEDDVIGSGVQVLGVRGIAPGSPGEAFVASAEYKDMADRYRNGKGKSRREVTVNTIDFAQAVANFMVKNATTTSGGLTSIEKLPGVVTLGVRPLTVKDLIAPGATNNTTIRYIREVSFTNAADVVAEGATKPAAAFVLEEIDSPVRKIAAYTKVTDELWADFLAVASYINQRLPYMVERTEEDQLLNGSGVGNNLTGLLNTTGIQTLAKGGDPLADAIYKSFTKVRWGNLAGTAQGGFEPDGIVIHPTDWEGLRLSKDGNNQYFGGGPFTGAYGNGSVVQFDMIWGKPVVITPAIAQGTVLTGAFRLASQYFQRQGLTIESTNTNEDDFIKNLTTIRAEERLALAVYRPAAFCQVTGA